MLKTRIIPVILYRGHTAIKGQQFRSWRSIGAVRQQVELYESRGVDEIVLLDIGTPAEQRPDFAMIRSLTEGCFMPVTVGGGFRQLADFQLGLANGADKLCCCHGALWGDRLIEQAAEKCGAQAVVVCLETFEGRCVSRIGVERRDLGEDVAVIARSVVDRGAGELILNAVDRDGMMGGYDLKTIERVASAVSVPVIALGGAGEPLHFKQSLDAGAHACAASAIFCWSEHTPRSVAQQLAGWGVAVRLDG